ncbi:MAG: Crp/Fnr family transcriptional regulator [Acidobacteria bacterium]|nr:Crp/Fnr family transcriptional regulator [Acidobacteriota bacterium]
MRDECAECPVLKSLLFQGLSSDQIMRLGCVFRPARYRRNQILFFEGGTAQHVFALHTGLVKIAKSLENGKERITRVLFPGELFGMEALTEPNYPLTAVTLRDCEICAADREEFTVFLRENPDICLGMVRFLVSEISRVRSQITDMSFKDARMKVATFLLSLIASETGSPSFPYTLTLPFSRQEISEILELSPETVSRTLGLFRRDHSIEARGRRLTVRDIEALRSAAHR